MDPVSPFFAVISRLSQVKRWPGRFSHTPEDVAQHVYQCASLAHLLGEIGCAVFGKRLDVGYIAIRALRHEDAEAVMGSDIAQPIKYANPAITKALKEAERAAEVSLINGLPEPLKSVMARYVHGGQSDEDRLVKAADVICCLVKTTRETQFHNPEFDVAHKRLLAHVADLRQELPEVDYFMAHFFPAMTMTLDAQSATLYGDQE